MKQKRSKAKSESVNEVSPSSEEAQDLEKKNGRPGVSSLEMDQPATTASCMNVS